MPNFKKTKEVEQEIKARTQMKNQNGRCSRNKNLGTISWGGTMG
jgi:hypothetical protein